MNILLAILGIWCVLGLIVFAWSIYKAPTIEDEDLLF